MSRLLRKRRLVWLLALGLLVMLSVGGYFSGRRYLDAAHWVSHTFEVTDSIQGILAHTHELESGQRGFLLSGNEAFLSPYVEARRHLPGELHKLHELTRDNPQQQGKVKELNRIVTQKCEFTSQAIEAKRAGGDFMSLVQSGRGRLLMDAIRELAVEMREVEKTLLKKRAGQAAGAQRRTVLFSLLGVSVTLGLSLFSLATVQRDLQEVTVLSEELVVAEKKFRELAENTSELVILVGPDGRIGYVSPSVERWLGYHPDEFMTLDPTTLITSDDLAASRVWVGHLIQEGLPTGIMTLRYRTKAGDYRWFEVHASLLREGAAALPSILFSARDIHERRLAQEQLEQKTGELQALSTTDALTGLLNRRGFSERATRIIDAARSSQRALAVVFLDLDGLKPINDQLGHEAGDRALSEAARVLRQTCRGGDLVARLGGDEFAVLAHDLNEEGYGRFRQRIEGTLQQINAEANRPFRLAFSLGAAFFDSNADESFESLLKRADALMYEEKRRRKAQAAELSS